MQPKEWHDKRRAGLGSSDAPVVMDVSPYMTRIELWLEKTGQETKDRSNPATQRGQDMEPVARAQYELEFDRSMPAAYMQHAEYPFIRANLDGWGDGIVLEIKCPGKENHKLACMGMVPKHYYPQLQHQLLVTGAAKAHYYSFDGVRGALVEVGRNEDYITALTIALKEFWYLVENKIRPAFSARDYREITEKPVLEMIEQWKSIKASIDDIKAVEEAIREKICEQLKDHPKWRCKDVSIFKTTRSGNIDYGNIPELSGVDLEQYRKGPGSESWTFKPVKG